jgi:hypothetical protein
LVSARDKGYDHLGGTFVFCPNCGTQNDSAATPCKKCGFKLSGISVPKFKGTMMLNSEQTVAEMIEEHRKKQAQGGAAEKPKPRASEPAPRRNPGSSAPPSSLGGPRGPVLQPPRVTAPTRGRMGGTMMGVAPQVGGYAPPGGAAAVPPSSTPAPAPTSPEPPQSETPTGEASVATAPAVSGDGAEAFAGSVEQGRGEPSPREPTAAAPARTRPLPAVPSPDGSVPDARTSDESAPDHAAFEAVPAPAADTHEPAPGAPRAVAVTAPLRRVPEAPASTPDEEKPAALTASNPPSPSRLRPLDIVLIICTCGIYGLMLWAKQRKPSA